ncbi:MAG: RNA 2',3'-cyclic phosphodiesterase [Nanoarchaeota archaeon]|nr:RNA 2',3'-cyclic phosphodiesterase [Nanoarchaeota archaeon]
MEEQNLTRCFIAIDLPREAINEIIKIQKLIKEKKLFDGKVVEGENLHLTLKFLGEIDEKKIEEVKRRLKEVKIEGFEANIGKIGVFPSRYNSYIRVLWIELKGKGVFELQKQIDECLNGLFEKENRFMSHITLARIKRVYDRNGFLDYLEKIKIPKMKFNINRFFLKKSELFPEGPVYEDLEEYSAEKKYS